MSDTERTAGYGHVSTEWPLPAHFGGTSYQLQIDAVLGAAGAALVASSHQAHRQLREALGEGGFEVLDAYVSAVTAASCAREEAVAALCYGLGRAAGGAEAHPQLGEAVVAVLLGSGLPAATAQRVAIEAVSALTGTRVSPT